MSRFVGIATVGAIKVSTFTTIPTVLARIRTTDLEEVLVTCMVYASRYDHQSPSRDSLGHL